MYDPPAAFSPMPPSFGAGAPAAPAPAAAASRSRRLGAWGVDTALLVAVAVLLGTMTWGRLNNVLGDGLWGEALSTIGGLLLSGGDVQQAATDFGTRIWRDIVTAVVQAFLLLVLIELLYRFAAERFTGRTLGKLLLDLRVESAGSARRRVFLRALVTTAGGTGLYSAAWILLLHGMFFFALLTWLAAVAVFFANGLFALAGRRRRTLADLAGRTVVVPAGTYRRAAEAAVQGAGAAWTGTQTAGRAIRDNAARLAQDERMRRALESEQARQVRDLGRQSADRLRGAVDGDQLRRAREAGHRLGGRLRGNRLGRGTAPDEQPAPPVPPPALPPPQPSYDPYPQQQQREEQQWWPPPPAPGQGQGQR